MIISWSFFANGKEKPGMVGDFEQALSRSIGSGADFYRFCPPRSTSSSLENAASGSQELPMARP